MRHLLDIGSNRPNTSDKLGRYYTKDEIGDFLVHQMGAVSPERLLDLGAGAGALSLAAVERWAPKAICTVDIDGDVEIRLKSLLRNKAGIRHRHVRADALSIDLPWRARSRDRGFDAAVCNPPFVVPRWRKRYGEILEDAGLSGCIPSAGGVDAPLLFLAQNLRSMGPNATLGIILPDSLVSSVRYKRFREELVLRYSVQRVIKLPRGAFVGTDALASILIVSTEKPTDKTIALSRLTQERGMTSEVVIAPDRAIERLDYDFHAATPTCAPPRYEVRRLADLLEDLRRGSVENALARTQEVPVLHTTHIDVDRVGTWRDFKSCTAEPSHPPHWVRAARGDILLARVGRNLEQKICGVSGGAPLLTDCVYRLRVRAKYREIVLDQLTSDRGQAWLASRAYGVGARQLSKADLMEFPIHLANNNGKVNHG
ncbi:DNA methylase [Burkholderia stabilis]|uniref:site-specific DNA-methyltransferase (adenine-specific) n=2 Tax=Burkholderia stabilis TaxID=95485 RepID=A0A4Q2A4L1_9BURK|nr:DNA methylase [Burkholderia stabilis]